MISSFCSLGDCVDVEFDGDWVYVHNTQDPERVLTFTRREWEQFLLGVQAGEFDIDSLP